MALGLTGHDIVHMDKNTFMWIQLTSFAIDADHSDHAQLAELIASPGYAHNYASPFSPAAEVVEPAVHGRWRLSSVRPESFEPFSATDAEALLQAWADEQEWTDPDFRQPPEIQERLRQVYALLRTGTLYKLINPGTADEHEYGFVTGNMGFHEFVVLDRSEHRIHVVVASDD